MNPPWSSTSLRAVDMSKILNRMQDENQAPPPTIKLENGTEITLTNSTTLSFDEFISEDYFKSYFVVAK
jgi:hypothetical protein